MNEVNKMTRARVGLLIDHIFWGELAMRLKIVPSDRVATAGVDGTHLFYNPKWIETLTGPCVEGLMAHEVGHVVFEHIWRRENRDIQLWNFACDFVINLILEECNFQLPEGALLDEQYRNMSVEQVYGLIQEKVQKQPQPKQSQGNGQGQGKSLSQSSSPSQSQPQKGQGKGSPSQGNKDNSKDITPDYGNCGSMMEPIGETAEQKEEQKAEWQSALQAAAQKSQGNMPSSLSRLVSGILNPTLPWFTLLRDFVDAHARNDYNWSRPNEKYLQRGIIVPSLISNELSDVVIAVDTSGSITDDILNQFANEVSGVLSSYDTRIHLIYCDAEVQSDEELSRADLPLVLKPKGGGGTDFRPVFNHIEKQGYSPKCLIYLTDLCGTFPIEHPDYPVMWVSTEKEQKAPFGITIDIN